MAGLETSVARAQALRHRFLGQRRESPGNEQELERFVSALLQEPEVVVPGAAKSPAGRIVHRMFADAQKVGLQF